MSVNNSLRTQSLQLYHFLCQHIVGTEETVRTTRLMIMISDNVELPDNYIRITSGSVGEGLQLKGSDLDIMYVLKTCVVYEHIENIKLDIEKVNFVMGMNDTKPGFTQLRAINCNDLNVLMQRGNSWYLSNEQFKLHYLKQLIAKSTNIIHGPCLSDKDESIDIAYCLHSPHWIQLADNLINRRHTSWPSSDVISDIIGHGVLFVPIGCKGSDNEDMEWRISFSVAEKLLIYSFNHTQLLCYASMKILLKDLINSNINCKNLLCSYFIKTIIFWVSEEIPVTEWKPENLIQCFLRCFKRLLYCVQYSMCPHYFIPIINMFENKIVEQPRQLLLQHLNTLFSFGWRSLLFSKQFQNFTVHLNASLSESETQCTQLLFILLSLASNEPSDNITEMSHSRCIQILNVNRSYIVKLICMCYTSIICSYIPQSIITSSKTNKNIYPQRRKQLAYLLQNTHHDGVSGWLMLASYFYQTKQYNDVLYILSYVMMKCTSGKVYRLDYVSSQQQLNMIQSSLSRKLGILRVLKIIRVYAIIFKKGSSLIPEELALDCVRENCRFPPDVFAHFLSFLCHYHLNDIQKCYNSIRDIQLTIDKTYFIACSYELGQCYILLGVALKIVGQKDLAILAFTNATRCETVKPTTAAERLAITYSSLNRN